jgi:hypothetical protein
MKYALILSLYCLINLTNGQIVGKPLDPITVALGTVINPKITMTFKETFLSLCIKGLPTVVILSETRVPKLADNPTTPLQSASAPSAGTTETEPPLPIKHKSHPVVPPIALDNINIISRELPQKTPKTNRLSYLGSVISAVKAMSPRGSKAKGKDYTGKSGSDMEVNSPKQSITERQTLSPRGESINNGSLTPSRGGNKVDCPDKKSPFMLLGKKKSLKSMPEKIKDGMEVSSVLESNKGQTMLSETLPAKPQVNQIKNEDHETHFQNYKKMRTSFFENLEGSKGENFCVNFLYTDGNLKSIVQLSYFNYFVVLQNNETYSYFQINNENIEKKDPKPILDKLYSMDFTISGMKTNHIKATIYPNGKEFIQEGDIQIEYGFLMTNRIYFDALRDSGPYLQYCQFLKDDLVGSCCYVLQYIGLDNKIYNRYIFNYNTLILDIKTETIKLTYTTIHSIKEMDLYIKGISEEAENIKVIQSRE